MKHMRILLAGMVAAIFLFMPGGQARAASVNNFYIQEYHIDYYLGRNTEGRSTLRTVESIKAVFPEANQNHGIERAIPNKYDGHPVDLKVASVTDAAGKRHKFTTYDAQDNTVLRIGDESSYVHGLQTYNITYTQSDVTRYFKDTNKDEFYWDTNGTEWKVPIIALQVRLHIDPALASALTTDRQCYIGVEGANKKCGLQKTEDGAAVTTGILRPKENATIALGFRSSTFAAYKKSFGQKILEYWLAVQAALLTVAIVLVAWYVIRAYRRHYRSAEIGVIVPEYVPPPDTSVSVAGAIIEKSPYMFSAQLIDLSVRHYLKIYQTRDKSLFRQAQYELEITKDISNLTEEEQELLRDIFDAPTVGSRLPLHKLKNNSGVRAKLRDNPEKLRKNITGVYALRARDSTQTAWFYHAGKLTLLAAVLLLSPPLLLAAIAAFVCGLVIKPLTDKGLQLVRYLKGLEMYIKVAETERLRMLQSPEGAEKLPAPIDTNDQRELIKLYEKVLPYAILFGQEKEWNKQLSHYYESAQAQPTWYHSNAGFNAVLFASAISDFSSAATYSNPSSSSSGGSGGGGFSGGGGGGGGGGGW